MTKNVVLTVILSHLAQIRAAIFFFQKPDVMVFFQKPDHHVQYQKKLII